METVSFSVMFMAVARGVGRWPVGPEFDVEAGAGTGAVDEADAAPVGLDDLAAQRQAQARAELLGALERAEDLLAPVAGHAGTVVDDVDRHAVTLAPYGDLHRALAVAGLAGVAQQVDQHVLEQHG